MIKHEFQHEINTSNSNTCNVGLFIVTFSMQILRKKNTPSPVLQFEHTAHDYHAFWTPFSLPSKEIYPACSKYVLDLILYNNGNILNKLFMFSTRFEEYY